MVVDFSNPYTVSVPVAGRCGVHLRGERMEEVKEFLVFGDCYANMERWMEK